MFINSLHEQTKNLIFYTEQKIVNCLYIIVFLFYICVIFWLIVHSIFCYVRKDCSRTFRSMMPYKKITFYHQPAQNWNILYFLILFTRLIWLHFLISNCGNPALVNVSIKRDAEPGLEPVTARGAQSSIDVCPSMDPANCGMFLKPGYLKFSLGIRMDCDIYLGYRKGLF